MAPLEAMLLSALAMGCALFVGNPLMSSNPLMTAVFFRLEREVTQKFAPCEHVSDDPPTARCNPKVYGRPAELIFIFDKVERVHAVLLGFEPMPSLDATQDLMKNVVDTLSGQFGPPKVKKNDVGAVWSWNNEHGTGTVRLAKTDNGLWVVTATLKEGGLPERYSHP